MIKNIKEIVIISIQLLIFYICPLFAGPTDTMGLIYLIILLTLMLSIIMGIISSKKIKYVYPIIISILFIPSIFIYYNESAFIHCLWYLVISFAGILIGTMINNLVKIINPKKN